MTKHEPVERWSDLRVGTIVFISLCLIILGISFAGGDKGLLLRKRAVVKALLTNVGGLKTGSAVTMSGMSVGRVTRLEFASTGTYQIEVTMEVREDVRGKIKTDSIPSVKTQGMLGDRYLDISPGSEKAHNLAEGGLLVGESAADFDGTIGQAQKILSSINEQKGTVGKLFYDEKFYNNLLQMSDEVNDFIRDFKKQPRKYIKFSLF